MSDKVELKDTFYKSIEVAKDGSVTVDEKAFDQALEVAGVTKEQYKDVVALNGAIASGFTEALAERALPVFKANKSLETIEATLPTVGRDNFKVSIDRTAEYQNPKTKEKIVKHGIVNLQHNVNGTRKGEFGSIKKQIAEQWTAALK